MDTRYDEKIIQEFADGLYQQADSVAGMYALVGAVIGGGPGFFVHGIIGLLAGVVLLGGLGYVLGRDRGFALKLQAQTALCQAQIERNTRSTP